MNLLSVLYIICSFIAFESSLTTYRLNRRAVENILFGLFSFAVALFYLSFSQLVASPDGESAMKWHLVTTIPGMFIAMMAFHFTLALTGYKKWASNPLFFLPLYLPSLYFLIRIYQGAIITGVGITPWGWDVIYDRGSAESFLGILHGILCLVASAILVLLWYRSEGNVLVKKQSRPVAMAFVVGAAGLTFVMIHLVTVNPLYSTVVADVAFAFFYTVFILGVRYSISMYRLMNLHPGVPVVDIMMGMQEACLLVNTEGDVVCMNREGQRLLEEPGDLKIHEYFSCPENIREKIKNSASSKDGRITIQCQLNDTKKTGFYTLYNMVIQCVFDEGGAVSGFFAVITADKSINDFQTRYNITKRQMEIITLVISGLSNLEVAGRLNLSERTVENHLFNIYNKIGIENKIELVKIAAKYRFLPE